jgi:hypothetical protein
VHRAGEREPLFFFSTPALRGIRMARWVGCLCPLTKPGVLLSRLHLVLPPCE